MDAFRNARDRSMEETASMKVKNIILEKKLKDKEDHILRLEAELRSTRNKFSHYEVELGKLSFKIKEHKQQLIRKYDI
jgi:chromosome segregation ATPase